MSNLPLQPPVAAPSAPQMSDPQPQSQEFAAELLAVHQELQGVLADLYPPLADLVRSQLQRAQPLLRAALVLAVGVGDPDHALLRQQRLLLAAAQEMLFIALNIHKLLLTPQPTQPDEQQKTIMGGIILTGDYCFSRSAILAAQTDHVQVVELFSKALQVISEGILRNFFADRANGGEANTAAGQPATHEQNELFISGVRAAAVLAALPAPTTTDLLDFVQQLAAQTPPYDIAAITAHLGAVRQVTPQQQARFAAFQTWLATHVNGSYPTGVHH